MKSNLIKSFPQKKDFAYKWKGQTTLAEKEMA